MPKQDEKNKELNHIIYNNILNNHLKSMFKYNVILTEYDFPCTIIHLLDYIMKIGIDNKIITITLNSPFTRVARSDVKVLLLFFFVILL